MANGLDKLERLFSARKKSAPSRATTATTDGSVPPAPSLFPQAPFIRPRCNVMYARDELDLYSPKPSVHTYLISTRRRSGNSLDADSQADMADPRRPSSFSTTASFHVPNRSSSLLSRRHNRVPTGLAQFPRDTATVDCYSTQHQQQAMRPLPLRIHKQDSQQQQIGLLEALPIYPTSHVETPPPSDQDDFHFPSPPKHHASKSSVSAMTQLTPEPSPDMVPYRDSTLSEPRRESLSAPPSSSSSSSKRVTISSAPLLDDDWRDSYVPVSPEPNKQVVFDEPHVKEFLSLTDDDLAEIKVVASSKPPTKRAPPPPILPPNVRITRPRGAPARRSMTPQSPHVASNEVAAWEAARIAKKYDFDVVYVANFWPSGMTNHFHNPTPETSTTPNPLSSLTTTRTRRNSTPRNSSVINVQSELSSPVSDCCPNSARATTSNRAAPTRLNGCLLAGYGLETIQAPFRLSARLHKKILRSEGWIEHRNSGARDNEFARGYARSFYTGTVAVPTAGTTPTTTITTTTAKTTTTTSTTSSSSRRASAPNASEAYHNNNNNGERNLHLHKVNRGIVFVAFRRPRGPGGTAHSSQAELAALEREAETLVELILDFHEEKRRWETLQEARKGAE